MANSLKEHNFFGYDATVVADSENPFGDRLTTMVVTFPRIVLAEFNTHRMFSRNSASSRAIPFKKMLERVKEHPFVPLAFQKEHTGMQGTEYFDKLDSEACIREWKYSVEETINGAQQLHDLGVTKQICNRLLEPFLWHTVIVSSTEWENFFALRCPQYFSGELEYRSWNDLVHDLMVNQKANRDVVDAYDEMPILERLKRNKSQADIHIQPVAEAMWDALNGSTPKKLAAGEWHIPFGDEIDEGKLWSVVNSWEQDRELEPAEVYFGTNEKGFEEAKLKIAVATCARISYGNISPADADYQKDIDLYDRLASSRHASPFEHVAEVMDMQEYFSYIKGKGDNWDDEVVDGVGKTYVDFSGDNIRKYSGWCGNFKGFVQQRYQEKI